ncbi:hypothetical protein CEXT_702471 [Caerostris extrusa]|uniref:Uncharacterized protein n=1 Tax=Caerostris extrusa TaxID=172846 RepID=A0AAV4TEB2_CAEEX|nr:hypothetical protein CEXT_702471 [Caerostris extrusa]
MADSVQLGEALFHCNEYSQPTGDSDTSRSKWKIFLSCGFKTLGPRQEVGFRNRLPYSFEPPPPDHSCLTLKSENMPHTRLGKQADSVVDLKFSVLEFMKLEVTYERRQIHKFPTCVLPVVRTSYPLAAESSMLQ